MSFVAVAIGGIGAATGLIGAGISSNAAGNAATTQANAANAAAQATLEGTKYQTDAMLKAAQEANSLQELMFLLGYDAQQPYQQVGTGALMTLKDLMQPGGYLSESAPQFEFDVSKVAQDPGYQFALEEGQKALERSAAARGTLLSGATAKALQRYGNDYATTKTNDVYNRDLTTYNTNIGTENMNRTNLFNRLSGLAGTGQQASGQMGAAAGQLGASMGNNLTGTAGNVANLNMSGINAAQNYLTGAANARASSQVAGANAWQSALGGIANNALDIWSIYQGGK
jgi:hypothetical protein